MEVYLQKSNIYESTVTTSKEVAMALYKAHEKTATLITNNVNNSNGQVEFTYYSITWKK